MNDGDFVMGVDVGTSAVRVALFTSTGSVAASSRFPRSLVGYTTFDADQLWEDFVACVKQLPDSLRRRPIRGVSFAGHIGTVLVDGRGRPIEPSSLWSDARGVDLLEAALATVPNAMVIAGRPVPSGSSLALVCWLRRHDPTLLRRVQWILSPKDYLVLRLTGQACTDATTAAYSLGFDVRQRIWSDDLLSLVGSHRASFPQVLAGTAVVGSLLPKAAATIGLPDATPVVIGGPDGTVGAAVLLGTAEDLIVDVAGTTDVLTALTSEPMSSPPWGAVLNPYVSPGLWSCGGPTGLTGGALVWLATTLGYPDLATALGRLQVEMEGLPPGCGGIFVLPLLSGSRFPDWDHRERAALWGITGSHTPAHILRAAQESVAYVSRQAIERLTARPNVAKKAMTVILAGGAAASRSMNQLRADVLGTPVLVADDAEVSVRGAAMLASVGSGVHPDLAQASRAMRPTLTRFDPHLGRSTAYQHLYRQWAANREALRRGGQHRITPINSYRESPSPSGAD